MKLKRHSNLFPTISVGYSIKLRSIEKQNHNHIFIEKYNYYINQYDKK